MAQMLSENCSQDFQDVEDCVSTSAIDPEYDAWFRRKVAKSIQAVAAGQLLSNEEVNRRAAARIQRALAAKGISV